MCVCVCVTCVCVCVCVCVLLMEWLGGEFYTMVRLHEIQLTMCHEHVLCNYFNMQLIITNSSFCSGGGRNLFLLFKNVIGSRSC